MRFQCRNCMSVVAIEDSEMGQPVACGNCGKVVVVPTERLGMGAVIGDFVIERFLGSGGLATVYLAHQLSLDRPAALKILHNKYAQDQSFIQDFIHEARAAAQLNHANIVQAYAVGEEDNIYFFAMEYVQGNTLKNVLLHSGRFVVDQALRIVQEIGTALDFAWNNKQLVHRDIKPDNIIVTENRKVKLADLGLARVRDDILEDHSGEIFGTPQYVAPEQLLGFPADNRSDIYSLGATFYHLVTGQCPFKGKTPAETAYKHISENLPSPKELAPDLPDQVVQVIRSMMAKRPGHRYQTAKELVDDLELVKKGEFPERCTLKSFETPIDINNLDQEMAATVTPEDEEEIASLKKRRQISRQAQEWANRSTSVKSASGRTGTKVKSKRQKENSKEKENDKPQTPSGRDDSSTPPKAAVVSSPAGHAGGTAASSGGSQPQERDQNASSSSRRQIKISGGSTRVPGKSGGKRSYQSQKAKKRAKSKKKSGSGKAILTALIVLLVFIVGGSIYFILQLIPPTEPRFDLSPEETLRLENLEERLEEKEGREALALLRGGIEAFSDYPETQEYLHSLAAPLIEEEARVRRAEFRQREMDRWNERSEELIAQAEEERRRREEEEERRRREAEERRRREAEERRREEELAELRERQEELRRLTIQESRKHNFREARIEYSVMARSDEDEFSQWAENQREMLEQAQKALNTFRNTGDELEGMRFVPPGEFRPARIASISRSTITSFYIDPVYEGGRQVGEERRTVRTRIDELSTERLVTLIEEAWIHQGGYDQSELDLMIGSFLLARGENLDQAQSRLEDAGGRLARALLEELEEVRKVVD